MIFKDVTLASGKQSDIEIEAGRVIKMGKVSGTGIDCSGLVALPGLVDLHTHLREPGFEASETIASGSRAAAAGGYTAVFAMANTNPVTDTSARADWIRAVAKQEAMVDVFPIGAITKGIAGGELSEIEEMAIKSDVRVFSDDGNCLESTELMLQAMQKVKRFDGVIAQHAQAKHLTEDAQMNHSALSVELGLRGWPAMAEAEIIARDAELAIQTGARYHACHVTTAEGLDVIRWAKSKGARITAEVTPHHLLLTEELIRSFNPVYKVNPPLRGKEDVKALRAGVLDGSIDILATDHAPHSAEKKNCEWRRAANGMVGLESAAAVLIQVLSEREMDWERFVEVSSRKPAEIGGATDHGQLTEGSVANLVFIDPADKTLLLSRTHSLSSNNPWAGIELPGRVIHTIFRGDFTVREGKLAD
jgi:dihydroorotase